MVLEYVAFRGFAESFRTFSIERAADASRGAFDARFALEALLKRGGPARLPFCVV